MWTVRGKGKSEFAPFAPARWDEDFLTFYHWPTDVETGSLIDWFRLPVRMDRFPALTKAIGWIPAPLTPTIPLRSIMASRQGLPVDRQTWWPAKAAPDGTDLADETDLDETDGTKETRCHKLALNTVLERDPRRGVTALPGREYKRMLEVEVQAEVIANGATGSATAGDEWA